MVVQYKISLIIALDTMDSNPKDKVGLLRQPIPNQLSIFWIADAAIINSCIWESALDRKQMF